VSGSAKSRNEVRLASSIPKGSATLESILCTDELQRRPSRPPDHAKENAAIVALASALAESRHTILETLADTILQVTDADSSGLSLLTADGATPDPKGERFYWPAIRGIWKEHVGGGTPRNFGPCGDVLDRDCTLLFRHFERRYPYLLPVSPAAVECLLVPFYVGGKAVGTIWAMMHSDRRGFDAEDHRLMNTLGQFASLAYQTLATIDDLKSEINAREKAERSLRELTDGLEMQVRTRTEELSLIIETIPGLVWCAAPDGELNYLNQRILNYTGTSPAEWAHDGWTRFLHPDDAEPAAHAWSRAVATGQPHDIQCRIRRSDGVYRWFRVLGQSARDSAGGVARWYGFLIDIDDRKNMEEALRNSEVRLSRAIQTATVGEFAAAIAHEINQPLTAVIANGQACLRWLAAEPPGIAKAQEAAERIVRDGKEAGQVVQRTRALFKHAAIDRIELDLNGVIGEVLHLLNGETARRGVTVETDLAENLAHVAGDRLQLQQLIFNLLLNAIEAMDPVPHGLRKLFICSKQPSPENVLVELRDCGTGIKDPDRIFEAFFTTKENGMGMGLAICRSIIDAHRGQLWAASGEGPGTTFSFTLPIQARSS
jgi:PAS domain S-box-containing protein